MPSQLIMLLRYINRSDILYNLRILVTMAGITFIPWLFNHIIWTIPLTLGAVAAALSDLDDRFIGRLQNMLLILCCFFIASVSIVVLMPYPWLFTLGLLISTWMFIMLGALGKRYATIAFGTSLIAIYTMLGYNLYPLWYQLPLLLLVGAFWYNLVAITGHLLFPIRPLQDKIIVCFDELANYLDAKAVLFDADEALDFDHQLVQLTMINSRIVDSFNQMKSALLTRLKNDRGHQKLQRILHYYFIVQEIHEQIRSTHANYKKLSDALRHSDILFRFQKVLHLQSKATRTIALSMNSKRNYVHDISISHALFNIDQAIHYFEAQSAQNNTLIASLYDVLTSLKMIDMRLANIESEQSSALEIAHHTLADDRLQSVQDAWLRIKHQLTTKSRLFRHAVRMSFVLCTGYLIIQITQLNQGYWIMLTSLFVCQPNYSATKKRLIYRILGTLGGIGLGLPLLYLVPSVEGQLIMIVISGVLFFSLRNARYAYATMFITIIVLLCFNFMELGFAVAIPRIIDTVIGCAIAWFAVSYIYPDWLFHDPLKTVKNALSTNGNYLNAALLQYQYGRSNTLDYRIARRDAHNSDVELASMIANISTEPQNKVFLLDQYIPLLCLNHTLLGYISAIGTHRQKINDNMLLALIQHAGHIIQSILLQGDTLNSESEKKLSLLKKELIKYREKQINTLPIIQELILIIDLIPELIQQSDKLNMSTSS